jgi:hypothetical protein
MMRELRSADVNTGMSWGHFWVTRPRHEPFSGTRARLSQP